MQLVKSMYKDIRSRVRDCAGYSQELGRAIRARLATSI